jgi:lambda repressor-like predicted transcriptional regulator
MHPEDIKATLKKAGSSQTSIARSLSSRGGKALSQSAVWHVIQGTTQSARIARRISEVTGVPISKLWPGKYPMVELLERAAANGDKAIAAALAAGPNGAAALAAEISTLRGPGAARAPKTRRAPRTQRAA